MDFNEEELLTQCLHHKDNPDAAQQAFNTLFTHYRQMILEYAQSSVGDRDKAEDAVQNTLIFCWQEILAGNYTYKPGKFKHWLLATCKNHNKHVQEGRKLEDKLWYKSRNVEPPVEEIAWTGLVSPGFISLLDTNPETTIPLSILSPMQRKVFEMVSDGYSYPRIAGELGISKNAVAHHASRARKKLQIAITPQREMA